jgi:hypothetical protein
MKKVLVFCVLLSLWLSLDGSGAWAIDVGWMQEGVRVWYFGAAGTGMSSDAEEAYLFTSIDGTNAQVTHHSTINHWVSPNPVDTGTYAILGKEGPCWIHPQTIRTLKSGDHWQGQEIVTVLPGPYTYDTFINEFPSIPYLLLPIKTLFDLRSERNMVKIVYMMENFSTGTAYFDAETGLLLFRTNSTGFVTVFFILSEINYDFASQQAFAEDNGPHTGFKSNIIKTSSTSNYVMIQSSVETRYGNTVQMWVSTSAGGSINIYAPPNENYCFFGSEPVLRRKYMTATPNYPPEGWNEYGEYLWWWVPQEALQSSSMNIVNVPMTRTSTEPFTFAAIEVGTGLYFSNIIFDNDGYMTDFSSKYSAIGLNIDLGPSASPGVPIHLIDGLEYYRNTMGRATPLPPSPTLISPSGTITTTTPTYSWNAVSEATEYDLKVNDSKGDKILRWYTSSEAGCASGIGTCSVTPTTALATGPGTWWIQTKNSAGTGPWSSGMSFTVEGISTPNLPIGSTNAGTNTSYSYVIGRSASNVGHSIQYFFDWGDGTNSDWLPVGTTSALHSWTSAGSYLIKAQARCAAHISAVSSWSGNLSVIVDTVSNPTTPSGVTSGTVGVSYVYSTSGSSSELGHPIQYLFDWGDGSNSGWLPVGKVTASKSWSSVGTYLIKVQARCSIHTSVVSLFSDVLTVSIEPPSITLQSPPNGDIFNSCSLTTSHQPTFTWTPNGTFTKITILFSPSLMDFTAPIVKASIQPTKNNWLPSIGIWQKIMVSSNNNGSIRDIYWKVVGAMKDKTLWESEPGNISIGNTTAPEIQSPGEGNKLPPGIPPTFIFNTNCNIKFELDISSVSDFGDPKKIKKITYTIKDPHLTPTVQKTLSSVQWKAVNKLIGTATGYFRFRAWDGIKRETISEVRSFTVQ